MSDGTRILLADDEKTFLLSTAELLRREGYECDCVYDADAAVSCLRKQRYDVLISDVKMPGNADLQLVRTLQDAAQGLSVILVTGYPELDTAARSVELPVAAYLIKPVDMDELLEHVRKAASRRRLLGAIEDSRRHAQEWFTVITRAYRVMKDRPTDTAAPSLEDFVSLTVGNVAAAMVDLERLFQSLGPEERERAACALRDCPRTAALSAVLREAVNVLRDTRHAFKSRQLAELRRKLEAILDDRPENRVA